ncbi:MAG: YezD family protein [Clostridia bacterium]|nr:YezD family protein [Clostridia bacterium]
MSKKVVELRKSQPDVIVIAVKKAVENLNNLKYGSVTLVVHDSQVVQIDRTEKVRFTKAN